MVEKGTYRVKSGLAEMLKGGVIMDVTTAEQAQIAEAAGAVAVMALERVPADIRAHGGVARMADPARVKEILSAVTIPVMAKVRIGHFVEAQVLEALEVDYIDESEVLTPADPQYHVNNPFIGVNYEWHLRDALYHSNLFLFGRRRKKGCILDDNVVNIERGGMVNHHASLDLRPFQ